MDEMEKTVQVLLKEAKTHKKKKLRSLYIQSVIENILLRNEVYRLVENNFVKTFDDYVEHTPLEKTDAEFVAISTAFDAAARLFAVFRSALEEAAREISKLTGEQVDEVIARLLEITLDEWDELSASIIACGKVLGEVPEDGMY